MWKTWWFMNPDDKVELISGRELARRCGVSEASIRKSRDNLRITSYDNEAGKYIWPAAGIEFDENRDLSKIREDAPDESPIGEGAVPKIEKRRGSRERMESAKADLAELELKRKRSELVPVMDVERQARKVGSLVKQKLMAIPDRIAADLAADTDQNSIKLKLDAAFREVLEAMSAESERIR